MSNSRDIERRLGQQYAQLLKESKHNQSVYSDCKEVIQASLSFMEHYNRLALALKTKIPAQATANAFM
jgi:hypothetical protein